MVDGMVLKRMYGKEESKGKRLFQVCLERWLLNWHVYLCEWFQWCTRLNESHRAASVDAAGRYCPTLQAVCWVAGLQCKGWRLWPPERYDMDTATREAVVRIFQLVLHQSMGCCAVHICQCFEDRRPQCQTWSDWTTVPVCWLIYEPAWFNVSSRFRLLQHGWSTDWDALNTTISLHWLHVQEHMTFIVAVLMYRALHGTVLPYLASQFTCVTDMPTRHRLR